MFKEQVRHESGITRCYVDNTRGKNIDFKKKMRLKNRGATLKLVQRHMERKVTRCYPRGPAFRRVVDLHTIKQLLDE